jgi:hypothetical protein
VRAAAETNFANPIALTMSGSQAANDVYSTVNSAFDAPVTLGVNADTTTAQTEVASLVAPQTLSLSANTTTAEQQVASLANPKTVAVDADTTKAEEQLAGLGGGVAVELDAENSIENIRTQLKEGIELDISAKSGASGILETIKGFVEQIKTAVEKIEPKLPQVALV